MNNEQPVLTSLANPRVKGVVKLRQRSHRDELDRMIIEGYRELCRALDNSHAPVELFICEELFQGHNEPALIERCADAGAELIRCSAPVFQKMAYRDRPEGLLAVAPQVHHTLDSLKLSRRPFIVVAESIEKPGNLGTILRSADATGADAVIVCDRCTDLNNPNVVRASIGTIFALPVVEATGKDTLDWLAANGIPIVAATPNSGRLYTDIDMTDAVAITIGTEQYGLTDQWLAHAGHKVRIPMLGQCDSLNVASATTILLYEVVRQRAG